MQTYIVSEDISFITFGWNTTISRNVVAAPTILDVETRGDKTNEALTSKGKHCKGCIVKK